MFINIYRHIKNTSLVWQVSTSDTYINFCVYDVYEATQDYDEIEHIPGITKVILLGKSVGKYG